MRRKHTNAAAPPQEMLSFFSWHLSCTAVPQLLPVQAPRLMNNLTRLGKQAMNDDRCDHCAEHEHDDSCCFHPLEHSLAIGRRSGGLPRSRRRHRTRGRTAFFAVCHDPANIQATSAVECDLCYGVRRPYGIALVCRCYTDLGSTKNFGSKRLQISGPPVASDFF